ncbi:MAG: TPMT family class I SAM-dependent methyltransferase [Bacteroidia bacterium]|nr:TPMT family class I SAM-dependent methyltransferase [Bacteroidia bacterium]
MNEEFLTKNYWNNRYQEKSTGWDIGYPSPPLMEYVINKVPKDWKILIPGSGFSHEAGSLYGLGYQHIWICEFAPSAVEYFKSRYPDFPEAQILMADFFELQNHSFQLILEQTFFCAINPGLRKKYFEQCHTLLQPGGILAGVLFNTVFENAGPPFGGYADEYYQLLDLNDWEVLKWEPCRNSIEPRQGREWWMELRKKQQ